MLCLAACDDADAIQYRSISNAHEPQKVETSASGVELWMWNPKNSMVPNLYFVRGASATTWNYGKNSQGTVIDPNIISAYNKLSPEERKSLGLDDPKFLALSKLTPEERKALGF